LNKVSKLEWVVYAKPPFGGPRQVLKYLARYTHRVAISNQRLVSLSEGEVTFRWKNYADANAVKEMTLDVREFTRRFLLHILPRGFVRIRHYGFLANRCRSEGWTTVGDYWPTVQTKQRHLNRLILPRANVRLIMSQSFVQCVGKVE